jgi:hypothetical protein
MKPLLEATPTWRRGGIAIVCEKCSKGRFAEDFPELASDERLDYKGYIKGRLRAEGRSGSIRVVTSSCLDVCARGGVTALINPVGDPTRPSRCVVVDALEGREALYATIVDELSPADPSRT